MRKFVFLLAALLPGVAAAEGDVAVTGKVGTLGFGGELTFRVAESMHLRVGGSGYNWYTDSTEDGVDYDATWRTRTASLIGDFFPIQDSIFRISLGLHYNGNKLEMTAKPNSSGNYEFQGNIYTAAEIGTLTGKLTFNKTAPYLGVGWGNPFVKPGSWGFALDIGALYQGRPKFRLSSDSAFCATDAQCQIDIADQQSETEGNLRKYRWYPVVTAGAVYRF